MAASAPPGKQDGTGKAAAGCFAGTVFVLSGPRPAGEAPSARSAGPVIFLRLVEG